MSKNESQITLTKQEVTALEVALVLIEQATYKEVEGSAMEDYVRAVLQLRQLISKAKKNFDEPKLLTNNTEKLEMPKKKKRKKKKK